MVMENIEICSIPAIAILCYIFIEVVKKCVPDDSNIKNTYPLISALLGTALGITFFLTEPNIILTDSVMSSALAGMASGLSDTGSNEIMKRLKSSSTKEKEDDRPTKYYITGDKHRNFDRLIKFCKENNLRKKDVIVILGDAGLNYYGDERDIKLKEKLSKINVTLLCIHGNKENRPQNISTYGIRTFCNGTVYYEPKYPNIFFAKDGETYTFNGKEFLTIGGAHSVDKIKCIEEGIPYWDDEMPDNDIKAYVENVLLERGNNIFGLLTHTCPISCLPTEMFISTAQNDYAALKKSFNKKKSEETGYPLDIDHSTEEWLEQIKEKTNFSVWFCGHYHIDKEIGKIHMMHKNIIPFCTDDE